MSSKVISLSALQNELAGKVELAPGEPHDVHQMNGAQYQRLQLLQSGEGSIAELYELAREVAPTLPNVRGLNIKVIRFILALAAQGVEAVQAMIANDPNAASPEPSSSTSPG